MNLQSVLLTNTSKLILLTLFSSIISIATSLLPAQAQSVISLKMMAKPNGAPDQCLSVDISKIGINPGANAARVETCRNIQEMRFIKENAGNGWFRYRVQNPAPNGQVQCLAVDGTKIGILPDAPWMRFEPCRAIQEVNFRPINYNNSWFNLQLQSNTPYCAAVDGTKIGIIPNAPNLRAEGCRPIQEHYWSEVLLGGGGTITPPPAPTITYQNVIENEKFDFVVASLRPKVGSSVSATGHAFTSLIRTWDNFQYKYSNGQFVSKVKIDSQIFYDTMSAAGVAYPLPLINGVNSNKTFSWERDKIFRWLNENRPSRIHDGDRTFSFISGAISKDNYYNYLPTSLGGRGYRVGNCTVYSLFPSTSDASGSDCNCSTYAVRFWNTLRPVFLGNYVTTLSSQSLSGINHPLILSKQIDAIFGWPDWDRNF